MGRKAHANYIEAALTVLQELGGGPISTKTMVAAAHERELIGDGEWVYHNFARRIRKSGLFDTSVRGQISLVGDAVPAEPIAPIEEAPVAVEEAVEETPIPETEPQTFPGPTLGAGFGDQ